MIVHIVPTVPPDFNGLADYCFKLSQNWPDSSASWGCLALEVPPDAQKKWPDSTLLKFEPSQKDLVNVLEGIDPHTLIVHYVGYAYQAKGIPLWLPAALKIWKKSHPQVRLVVMFHELWATGAPWRSCFWVLPAAKAIVADLAIASDFWITSCQNYFDKVVRVGGTAEKGKLIPVATNIEPNEPVDFGRAWPLFEGNKLKIAVFGLATTRNTALNNHLDLLQELCAQDLVAQISIMGQSPQSETDSANLNAMVAKVGHESLWHRAYDLSSQQASKLLKEHDVGIVKETAPLLTKSGVFAALCSHGILPICTGSESMTDRQDAPFLENFQAKQSVLWLQNENFIETKKRSIQSLATTSLNWSSVATLWMRHIERPQ